MIHPHALRALLVSSGLAFASLAVDAAPGNSAKGPGKSPTEPSAPLVISGTPQPDATVGAAWRFQPAVDGGNGRRLKWQVQNPPAWTSFNRNSGLLEGTPAAADVGTSSDVRISVTDGTTTATLAEFSIQIHARQGTTGSAELSWVAPTERTDGAPVGALAGYRILYGTASGQYDQSAQINNPGITQYLVEHLAPGTWYFAVTAMTADAMESQPSTEVSKAHGG